MRRRIGRYADIPEMNEFQVRDLLNDLIAHLGLDVYEEYEEGRTPREDRHVSYEFEKS